MTISADTEAKILRYFHVEKWLVGTISNALGVHHTTIKRVLSKTGIPKENLLVQKSIIDSFVPFILDILKKHPTLPASRLYAMVCERGYHGGPDHFRHLISYYRPRAVPEAYLRLRTLPAEQAQVDWAHFGHITIGKAKRPLMAFVMVLSYSRKICLYFCLNARMENFLRGHEQAFAQWGGVPKVLLYDNLKSAVLERQGDAIRFHPVLLDFAAHYRFEPRPVAVARGNEKGRVERAIRYVRDNFFPARQWEDIDDLNAQAKIWFDGPASDRPCPEDKSFSVGEIFLQEKHKLIALPDNPFSTEEQENVKVGKTPYIRFDWNDYSVPHTYTRCTLTVSATLKEVKVLNGTEVIATHKRSFDKAHQVENPAHIEELVKRKKQARVHRGQDRLTHVVSCGSDFLIKAAERNYHLASMTKQMLQLLDDYGAAELEEATKEALEKEIPHPNAVHVILEKRREQRQQPPPLRVNLPDDRRVRDLAVKPHNLNDYDALQLSLENDNDNEQ